MTNEEYIRKAVELADGWFIAKNGAITLPQPKDAYIDWPLLYLSDFPTLKPQVVLNWVLLDALAAQLVRQVLAKGIPFEITHDVDKWGVALMEGYDVYVGHPIDYVLECAKDSDRTMNTLKAIVESGVLENPAP